MTKAWRNEGQAQVHRRTTYTHVVIAVKPGVVEGFSNVEADLEFENWKRSNGEMLAGK